MKRQCQYSFFLGMLLIIFYPRQAAAKDNKTDVLIGAYYFDGWKSLSGNPHLTQSLKVNFANREPKWGWLTSTQSVVDDQIDAAVNAGLSFFSFCWYYKAGIPTDSSNRALYYFNNSTKRNELKYCLMVANHQGYKIGPNEWNMVSAIWLNQFKKNNYLMVDNKPLIIFFSIGTLVEKFKSPENVKMAFKQLHDQAVAKGFNGVTIAACCSPDEKTVQQAKACGFDVLTGYNYHGYGLKKEKGETKVPIANMQTAEKGIWSKFAQISTLPYIPATTLNWDPRPWATAKNKYAAAPYFVGFSPATVATSIRNAKNWVKNHSQNTTSTKVVLIYAWNEYGEGAYLTPSKNGANFLNGAERVLKK